jgi:peptide/nickel transport system substrate-binding protein
MIYPRIWRRLSVLLILVLAGCGSTPSVREPNETVGAPVATVPSGRGAGDTLRLLWVQAPTILNPHLSTGTKDFDASRVTYEPLASFNNAGELVPFLADEIPSLQNGGVAQDGKSVTWKLKHDILWSDGKPFSAEDVKFTFDFISDPATAATTTNTYSSVEQVEVLDPYTVKVHFKDINPSWSLPFVGTAGLIIPKHIFQPYLGAAAREAPANLQPIGTGPYRVVEFKPGDVVIYEPNEHFRELDKPYFSRVELKGGGDPGTAARAVLQTGDYDFVPAVSAPQQQLDQFLANGKGVLLPGVFSGLSERIDLNRNDPHTEIDGERASTPHPFFSDLRVRQAFSLAIDRQTLVNQIYAPNGEAITNAIVAPPTYHSPNTSLAYDPKRAAELLDEAGWVDTDGDGVREKDGRRLSILYQTAVSSNRQKTQEVIKQALEAVGFEVELKSIDNGVFFSSDASNTDTFNHFYADVEVYTFGNYNPDPAAYLALYTCDNVVSKANNWSTGNRVRYCNPEYDALFEQSQTELDPEKRKALFIQLNDLLVEDVVIIPLLRGATQPAASRSLQNIEISPWESTLWLIKDWTRETL